MPFCSIFLPISAVFLALCIIAVQKRERPCSRLSMQGRSLMVRPAFQPEKGVLNGVVFLEDLLKVGALDFLQSFLQGQTRDER